MNNIILSFLKSKNVSYYFTDGKIAFPCFNCKNSMTMNALDGIWNCTNCLQKGNLMTLQKLWERNKEELSNIEIYNPKKEIREIRSLLKKLDQNELSQKIIYKVEKFINYSNNNQGN